MPDNDSKILSKSETIRGYAVCVNPLIFPRSDDNPVLFVCGRQRATTFVSSAWRTPEGTALLPPINFGCCPELTLEILLLLCSSQGCPCLLQCFVNAWSVAADANDLGHAFIFI